MDKLHYKGKGEHSVRELELIIEQQAEELHLLNSGQKQLNMHDVSSAVCENMYENRNCKLMCLTRCIDGNRFI